MVTLLIWLTWWWAAKVSGITTRRIDDVRDALCNPKDDPASVALGGSVVGMVIGFSAGLGGWLFDAAEDSLYWPVAFALFSLHSGVAVYCVGKWVAVRWKWVANRFTLLDEILALGTAAILGFAVYVLPG